MHATITLSQTDSRKAESVSEKPSAAPWRKPSAISSFVHETKRRIRRQLDIPNGSCCEACRNIWIWQPVRFSRLTLWSRPTLPAGYREHGYPLDYGTVAQLRERSTCVYCRFIALQIDSAVTHELRRLGAKLEEAQRPTKAHRSDQRSHWLEAHVKSLESAESMLVSTEVRYRSSTVKVHLKDPSNGVQIRVGVFHMLSMEDYRRYHSHGYILQSADFFGGSFDAARTSLLLEHCSKFHRHTAYTGLGQDETLQLLLVDVRRGCLVTGDTSNTYLALSYVWGDATTFQTVTDNVDSMRIEGALFSEGKVAGVIRDAMSVVESLGYRYLWVDALSIVQDSAAKPFYVERMDIIYTKALCTIVAAGCRNANQAISGVRAGSRPPVKSGFWNGCSLVRMGEESDKAFAAAPSETRAWTFQERLVSPRLLIFTEHEVILRCAKETHQESPSYIGRNTQPWELQYRVPTYDLFHGILGRDSDSYWKNIKKAVQNQESTNIELMFVYRDLVCAYTKRALTREDDIHNAFMGIQNHLTVRCGTAFLAALPVAGFAFALMWYSPDESSRKRVTQMEDNDSPQELTYPSWSWLAWTREVRWGYPLDALHHGAILDTFSELWNCRVGLTSAKVFMTKGDQNKDLRTVQEDAHHTPNPSFDFIEFETNFAPTDRFAFASFNAFRYRGIESGFEIVDAKGTHCGAVLGVAMSQPERLKDTELVEVFTSVNLREFVPDSHSYHSDLPLVNCLIIKWDGRFAKRVAIAQVIQEAWDKIKVGSKTVMLI